MVMTVPMGVLALLAVVGGLFGAGIASGIEHSISTVSHGAAHGHAIWVPLLKTALVAGGIFAIAGAAFNWEWFMTARKARFIVAIAGRTGARIFYGVLGIALSVAGVLNLTGFIAPPN